MTRILVLLLVVIPNLLLAQGERGAISGTVTGPSGSAVPGAKLTAVHVETGVGTSAVLAESGAYRLLYLRPGDYRITASGPGFRNSAVTASLHPAQTLTIDFRLEAGENGEGQIPLLERATSAIGRYVGRQEFEKWPLAVGNGRRQILDPVFRSLPGPVGDAYQGSINGGQYFAHEILIEGIPVGGMDMQGGSSSESGPSLEAVGEFTLQTRALGIQYNGGQTAVANFAIRSGSPVLHGSAYGYVQNDALRANSFANNAIGRPRAPFKMFNWGAAGGGPVYLPKLYDGRNKSFWFFNLEDFRSRNFTSTALATTLPAPDFKRGDFSRLYDPRLTGRAQSGAAAGADALGRTVRSGQIYDPATTRTVGSTVVRDPFPGNIIPPDRWSPVSRKILEAGISDPITSGMLNNMATLSSSYPVLDERDYSVKGDHLINSAHRLSAYFGMTGRQRYNAADGAWGAPPGPPTSVYRLQSRPGRMARLAED